MSRFPIPGSRDSQIPESRDSRIPGFPASRMPGSPDPGISSFITWGSPHDQAGDPPRVDPRHRKASVGNGWQQNREVQIGGKEVGMCANPSTAEPFAFFDVSSWTEHDQWFSMFRGRSTSMTQPTVLPDFVFRVLLSSQCFVSCSSGPKDKKEFRGERLGDHGERFRERGNTLFGRKRGKPSHLDGSGHRGLTDLKRPGPKARRI